MVMIQSLIWLALGGLTATLQIGDVRFTVHAREAEGDERETLFKALAEKTPDYEQYRSWTSRRIPLVILKRIVTNQL